MSSPLDLEEEVDHSFFDSDCDDNISKDKVETVDTVVNADKDYLHNAHPVAHEHDCKRTADKEGSSGNQEEKLSRTSSISSISCSSDKAFRNGSDAEDASSAHSSEKSNEAFLALLAGNNGLDDEDGYHQSQDESEEDEKGAGRTYGGQRASTPKKLLRKHYPRSPSLTSSETDDETDTDSSSEGPHESRSKEHPTSTRARISLPVSASSARGHTVVSAKCLERPATPTEESEDTVTDVTPLSTPDSTPLQSLDLTQACELKETPLLEASQQTQMPEPVSPGRKAPQEEEDFVDECSLSAIRQERYDLVSTGGRRRKNFSFSNDEVRRIDRENQRLLQGLTRLSTRPGQVLGKSHTTKSPVRLYHTAVNRQKEQQRIERENMAFLKRLETIKPTPGLRRAEQLSDYQRQARFSSSDQFSICSNTSTKKDWSYNRTPSGKSSRVNSATHSSTRASLATVDATHSHATRSHNNIAARPAWC